MFRHPKHHSTYNNSKCTSEPKEVADEAHINNPYVTYLPHIGGPYLSYPHGQYMVSPHIPHTSSHVPYTSTSVPCIDNPGVPYTVSTPKIVTPQKFSSTATTPVSFSELLESNLSPWELGY
ncbi:hypothetical protein MKX01_000251 [Papaver californicum]|nr:hypothetical protein MKX01_000251 [Papaver californicum]